MKLVYMDDGTPVQKGDEVTSGHDNLYVVIGWDVPRHPRSDACVRVRCLKPLVFETKYLPAVFAMEWIR